MGMFKELQSLSTIQEEAIVIDALDGPWRTRAPDQWCSKVCMGCCPSGSSLSGSPTSLPPAIAGISPFHSYTSGRETPGCQRLTRRD